MAGSIHSFKITGTVTPENVKLEKYTLGYNIIRLERNQCDFKWKQN